MEETGERLRSLVVAGHYARLMFELVEHTLDALQPRWRGKSQAVDSRRLVLSRMIGRMRASAS